MDKGSEGVKHYERANSGQEDAWTSLTDLRTCGHTWKRMGGAMMPAPGGYVGHDLLMQEHGGRQIMGGFRYRMRDTEVFDYAESDG